MVLRVEKNKKMNHNFTDESEEAMYVVSYLQDETKLRMTYLMGKCCLAPTKHMKKPKLEPQAASYILQSSSQKTDFQQL